MTSEIPAPNSTTSIVNQANITRNELANARETWVASGLNAAQFDGAATADGHEVFKPSTVTATKTDFNLAPNPSPEDYTPKFANAEKFSIDRLVTVSKETREWAAALGFEASIGTQVIEHISEWGPRLAKMDPAEKAAWIQEQNGQALRAAGGERQLEELKILALKTLDIAGENGISRSLKNSTLLASPFLIVTLANHYRSVVAWKSSQIKS